jgi:hypothetical protein
VPQATVLSQTALELVKLKYAILEHATPQWTEQTQLQMLQLLLTNLHQNAVRMVTTDSAMSLSVLD